MIQRRAKTPGFLYVNDKTNKLKGDIWNPSPIKVHGSCATKLRETWISLMPIYLQLLKGAFEAVLKNSAHHLSGDYKFMLIEN